MTGESECVPSSVLEPPTYLRWNRLFPDQTERTRRFERIDNFTRVDPRDRLTRRDLLPPLPLRTDFRDNERRGIRPDAESKLKGNK